MGWSSWLDRHPENPVRLYDATHGRRAVFSPDGKRIASGSADGTVRFWDAATNQPLGDPLTGHVFAPGIPSIASIVDNVAFSHDGQRIASLGFGMLWLWPAYPDPTSALCAKLTQNMSHKQWRDWVSPDIGYIKTCPDLPIVPD